MKRRLSILTAVVLLCGLLTCVNLSAAETEITIDLGAISYDDIPNDQEPEPVGILHFMS